jgi:hypothetical protein
MKEELNCEALTGALEMLRTYRSISKGGKSMIYNIEPVKRGNSPINLDGWRIVRSDGAVLNGITTKRQAEQLVEFFTEESGEERR